MLSTSTLRQELEAEVQAAQRLSICVRGELDAIRSDHHQRLSTLIDEKQTLLEELDRIRSRREALVSAHCEALRTQHTTLASLLDGLDSNQAQPLIRLRLDLLRHLRNLREMNRTGRRYTRRKIRFLSERRAVLSGEGNSNAGEYVSSGAARSAPTSGVALDMKV